MRRIIMAGPSRHELALAHASGTLVDLTICYGADPVPARIHAVERISTRSWRIKGQLVFSREVAENFEGTYNPENGSGILETTAPAQLV